MSDFRTADALDGGIPPHYPWGTMTDWMNDLQRAEWYNEPPRWAWSEGALVVTTGKQNDFWQDTYYGFRRDDGHFLGRTVAGDFTAVLSFQAEYHQLYDQAGLMLRRDAGNWVKAGIEYSDGQTNFSVVMTRGGQSDWSVVGVPGLSGPQEIRISRVGSAVIVHHAGQGGEWHLMRLGNWISEADIELGPMVCSPQGEGLVVRFSGLDVGPPGEDPLHG